ncbi:MAG: sulfatase-like hydrolase/transferase [Planctomycetaceae bacterium]|nr:sulfatase-like hydrolase/transferase [Planctomycetaceae bacterium]
MVTVSDASDSWKRILKISLILGIFLPEFGEITASEDWPGFRGPQGSGLADGHETAVRWDATDPDDASVLWRTPIPGLGHSCPIIAGDRLFVATARPDDDAETDVQIGRGGNVDTASDDSEHTWSVLCLDKNSGQLLWQQEAHAGVPQTTRHTKSSHANPTVAVSGDNVVAFFGSEGLFCYSLDGELKWKRDLGVIDVTWSGIGWGYSSSPAVFKDHIVLVCDVADDPYVMALSLKDGEQLWRTSRRDDCEGSWGSPFIYTTDGQQRVVINGWPWIVAYDLNSGEEVWRVKGGGDIPVPTPFVARETVYMTNAHGGKSPIIAVRTDADGNLTESESPEQAGLAWRVERGGSYMSTPVVVGDYIYLATTNGVIRCFDAGTGEKIYEKRLGSGAYIVSSLVAANERIYVPSEDGTVYVVAAGPQYKLLSKNRLGAPCLATPAISEGVIYFRTTEGLLAIGPDKQPAAPTSNRKPNVLFIAVDDLRPTLGCYGDPLAISPNIDRLASQGVRFQRAYCQVAVCNPSRASLMTGLRPDNLGVWTLPIHFREAQPDAVTLPQWLRKSGYTAISHGKIYHNPTPDPQSWSEPIRDLPSLPYFYPDGTRESVRSAMEKLPAGDWRKNNLRGPATAAPELADNQLLDGARTDLCIEDLQRLARADAPFFLAMGYIRPHLSFVAPKKYWDMYDPEKLPVLRQQKQPVDAPPYALANNSEVSHYVDMMEMPKPWDDRELSAEQAQRLVHGYHACVSYIDAQIGRLLDALEASGAADNTIVVLWSDHGYKLGEYRGWGKMSNYEIDTRVPLIIRAPSMPKTAGQSSEALAELLDVYPTLCELTGVETPDFVDGKSLVPVLHNTKTRVHQAAVSQYYRRHEGDAYMGYALRTDRWRYVEWRDFESGEIKERELYDHSQEAASHLGGAEEANLAESADEDIIRKLSVMLWSTHPPRKLDLTPAVHTSPSGTGRLAVDISFRNTHDGAVTVYPIQPTGKRSRGRKLNPGESVTYNARLGGVYVVESEDGTIHQIHSPAWPAKTIEVH